MAVVVKSNQAEEAELICGVSGDCVILEPAKVEAEPVSFSSVNNGLYETAELYNCQPAEPVPTYQQLTSFQPFAEDTQMHGSKVQTTKAENVIDYLGADEFKKSKQHHMDYGEQQVGYAEQQVDYKELPMEHQVGHVEQHVDYAELTGGHADQQVGHMEQHVDYVELSEGQAEQSVDHLQTEVAQTELSEHSSTTNSVPLQDFYDIQVAEEEVVSDNWNIAHTEVIEEDSRRRRLDSSKSVDEVEIPLPQDQDIYSQMHPYPCDFCSRRFSKKSTLMSHMVSHQTERPHGCNMCGARYRRKSDLVNHMKIHAYMPSRTTPYREDKEDLHGVGSKGRRKKMQSLVPKRTSFSSDLSDSFELRDDKKSVKKWIKKNKSMMSKNRSYTGEELRLLSDLSRSSDVDLQEPRWPVIDQSRPYVCQHCGVGFAREKALASHSRVHGGDSPLECEGCGEMFWDVALLREHMRARHPHLDASLSARKALAARTSANSYPPPTAPTASFFCDTCGLTFPRLDLLKKHRRMHVKIEPKQEQEEEEDHLCAVCGQFFESAMELREHSESHLQDTISHLCVSCGMTFSEAGELSQHVMANHTAPPDSYDRDQETTCTLCGKVCKDRRTLAKHACVDSENRSFTCFTCSKRFHSRARLRRHMVSHRDKAVSCSDCGEEFPDGRALMSHRHSHNTSGNHAARSFPCHDCGKTFGSRSSQQIHVRIHTGERPYGCRFCWKAFADGGTLRKHERIHTGEKPYVCPVCPKAFNQRVVLREHIRAHHSGSDSKVNSCYECKVCGCLFPSSGELCLHLVQHSDENTAKHRMPSLGPRKYKRRRKVDTSSPGKASPTPSLTLDFGSTDSSDSMIESKPKKIVKKKYSYDHEDSPPRCNDLGNAVVESFETAIQNISSMMVKSEPKRKKMDKELKKHKTTALSKLTKLARIEKRAKAAKLLNNTSYASKYVVSRPEDKSLEALMSPRTKTVSYPTLEDTFDTILNGADALRNRPRTKNVNYHNVTTKSTKLEPATFPTSKTKKQRTKVKKTFIKKEKTKLSPNEILNGSNPIEVEESNLVSEENLETCIVDDFNIEGVHNLLKPEEMQQIEQNRCAVETIMVKSEVLSCEMCGDHFSDRSELLAHIRVHI